MKKEQELEIITTAYFLEERMFGNVSLVKVSIKSALPASPAKRPKTASSGVMAFPCWIWMLHRSQTVPIRIVCSNSCAVAGMPVFFLPR